MRIDCLQQSDNSWVSTASRRLLQDGFIVLDHALPVELVQSMKAGFFEQRPDFAQIQATNEELQLTQVKKVGELRYMIPIELSYPFSNPLTYANPFVLSLLWDALGKDMKIDNFGVVVALPGAKDQPIHMDSPTLFNGPIDGLLPPHAITVAIPLVEMNNLHGTTALLPGTHRKVHPEPELVEPVTPVVPLGSCVLWDYRLQHGGTANQSDRHRPILYLTYARMWYQDTTNFRDKQLQRLKIPAGFLDAVPSHLRSLFAHV